MEEKDMTKSDNLEQVLDFLEDDQMMTDADIEKMLADDEACRLVDDFQDCKQAMLEKYSHRAPNVNDEWDKFIKGKEPVEPGAGQGVDEEAQKIPFLKKHRQVFLGSIIGIAATLLCLLVFTWYKDFNRTQLPAGLVVFEAKDAPQEITLQNGDGDAMVIDEGQQNANMPALVARGKGRTMLNYHSAANNNRPSIIQLLTTPIGKDYQVTLSDGTHVYLSADSRLEYPSKFEGDERKVTLEGEAYFDVAKDAKHPFIVKTDQLETRVLGTKFNVANYMGKFTRVTLIEGAVNVKSIKDGQFTRLAPGDEVVVDENGKMTRNAIDVDGYVYWQEGFFYFDNQPLSEIMQTMGRWYNVNVVFANKDAMNYRFHYLCERKAGIDHAIELLNRMKKLHITRQESTVVVR